MVSFKNSVDEFDLYSEWNNGVCSLKLHNPSDKTVSLNELEICNMEMPFAADTYCYGEGYNKLCQYEGTVSDLKMIGSYGDYEHYKMPIENEYFQTYNMVIFKPENEKTTLLGFTSCNRFTGIFRFNSERFRIIINLEGIEIKPDETIELEKFYEGEGRKNELLKEFGKHINENHKMPPTQEVPTGWCSWLVYGPDITEDEIIKNLEAIKKNNLDLKYIQIDDGYQAAMGDWLHTTDKFKNGMESLCKKIKSMGFEPAIWVAPFIAQKDSTLLREHPEWFVKDTDGKPLPSDRYSYGGWRYGPWYMLDTSHPGAREYLTHVFKTMREEWGVKYFKLDANMWGALPLGIRHVKNMTAVESYRLGMKAIIDGAGYDSFLLGCNAPMWPSIGVVHGMRVTNDNNRSFDRFKQLTTECFRRNWQHGVLWVNDPDTVLLKDNETVVVGPDGKPVIVKDNVPFNEYMFCAAYVLASGGMILSSDDVSALSNKEIAVLKKMLPPTSVSAEFNDTFEVGISKLDDEKRRIFVFNYGDEAKEYCLSIKKDEKIFDYWTDELVSSGQDEYKLKLEPHTSAVFECTNG